MDMMKRLKSSNFVFIFLIYAISKYNNCEYFWFLILKGKKEESTH